MPTANEAFRDALIRHQIGLARMAPGITAKVNALLSATEEDIEDQIISRELKGLSTNRLNATLKAIRSVRSDAWKKTGILWVKEMEDIAEHEAVFLDEVLNTVSPAVLNTTLPEPAKLRALVATTPFEGEVMEDWVSRQQAGDIARIHQSIRIGLTQGESSRDIARRIIGTPQFHKTDGIMQITRNHADTITRTAINAISNAAKQEYYGENQDILGLEIFLATLDARTTLVCAKNDKKRFPHGQGPIPPLHWRCRSLRLATMNAEVIGMRPARNFTEKMLLREFSSQRNISAPTKRSGLPRGMKTEYDKFAQRRMRELTGPVPASTSYQEWLMGQTSKVQDDILGPTRAKLFRSGEFTLDRFTNRAGDKLTLSQLKMRDREAMVDALGAEAVEDL